MRTAIMAFAVVVLACSSVYAGALASDPNAYWDPAAGSYVRGTKILTTTDLQGKSLSATIDYCVYGPGSFTYGSYSTLTGTKTPAANEFTYAYQITAVGGNDTLSSFWMNMIDSNEATDIGRFSLGSGVVPSDMYFAGTYPTLNTANWDFYPPNLAVAAASEGLVYVSVNAPVWQPGWIQDGGLSASALLPSPSDVIPEPATMILLAGGVLGLLRRRG
jgi:hypothetical protein